MFENLVTKVKDPRILKGAGIVVGSLAAIGVVALVISGMNEDLDGLEDLTGEAEFDTDSDE